jgi:hypothetical protein
MSIKHILSYFTAVNANPSGTTSPNPGFAGVRVLFYFTFIYELLVLVRGLA